MGASVVTTEELEKTLAKLPKEFASLIETDKNVRNAVISVLQEVKLHPSKAFASETVDIMRDNEMLELPSVKNIANEIIKQLDEKPAAAKRRVVRHVKTTATATSKAMKAMNRYCLPGQALEDGKWFINIVGPAGVGKTYDARVFARDAGFDLVVEVACLDDMEPRDFIGGTAVDEKGNFTFVYGPLSRAWAAARDGKNVLIIIDEMSNIPTKAKQAFQTAVSPDFDGNLWLETGKVLKGSKDATIEQIQAPAANISIIGTSNAGSKYQVVSSTPAIRARFKPIYVEADVPAVRRIIGSMCKARGWKADLVKCIINLFKKAGDSEKKQLLDGSPAIRELTHWVNSIPSDCDGDTEAATAKLKEMLLCPDQGNDTWFVAEDHEGRPMGDQMTSWTEVVERSFA